ncbi:MlaC/ttg2D family ABC transporter substrate-binding protein [Thiohalophilus thiocyanatoxydans]|uniref:Phospholipid transport system substrate-binding protein n=1 Tax=Thiohalophilus thiocyanatoxydans TaxID=381308 RepID=A0A4R8IPJ5_9GAMM|nr:ABC transporter substrate-binding protein [Thiohalophilus thiocyanatoxydans]TDY01100.1 phospholipid transport system substrate-binding protein [Thiohalophilus thiocyanatoxydans]
MIGSCWRGPLTGALLMLAGSLAGAAAATQGPQQRVIEATGRVLAALEHQAPQFEQTPARIDARIREIVQPHFDFVRMAGWVLGKHWHNATPEQQLRFGHAFRQVLLSSYAATLRAYRGQGIEYLPLRADPAGGEVTVRSRTLQPGRAPVVLNYTLWERDGRWRVYDISVDGISLVANYRTRFAGEIKAHGLDALIMRLEQHNRTGEPLQ